MTNISSTQLTLPLIDVKSSAQISCADMVLSSMNPEGGLIFVNVVDCGRVNALLIGQLLSSCFGDSLRWLPMVHHGQRGGLITSSMKPSQQSFLLKKLTNPAGRTDPLSSPKIINLQNRLGSDLKPVSVQTGWIDDFSPELGSEWDYLVIDDCRDFLGGAKSRGNPSSKLLEWSRDQKANGKIVVWVQRAARKDADLSHMLGTSADSVLTIHGGNRGRWLKELLYSIAVKSGNRQYEVVVRCKRKDGCWVWSSEVANFATETAFCN